MSQSLSQVAIILEKYIFYFSNLPERLKCVLCHEILKNAKQTSCGCKVCEKCITSYLFDGPKSCPSNESDCMNVKLDIKRDICQDNATNKEIGNVMVNCPFHKCLHSSALRNMVEHIDFCEFREIICEQCTNKFSAKEKANHEKDHCETRMVKSIYCSLPLSFKDMNADMCANKKLDCKIDKMTKKKLKEKKIKNLETENTKLQSQLDTQVSITRELFDMNRKSSESFLKIEKSIDELKKKSPSAESQTVDNKSAIFRNSSFIWKFTDFEVRRVDAESGGRVSVTSDPFCTSEFGYKMCLRVYPAGDGVGKGTHLSVFFAIMKGEFDDLLSWPFRQKVTLSILDQESCSRHYSVTVIPDARSACYQKPTDECNIASGSHKFILLSLITNNTIYCTNGTIFLKIAVDTKGISKP